MLLMSLKNVRLRSIAHRAVLSMFIGLASISVGLEAKELNPDISVVLDALYIQNEYALSHVGPGFVPGHNEISFGAPIDNLFNGRLTAVIEDHEGETEIGLEEAFVQTSGLGYGLGVKAGRFLSAIGYLNGQHTHGDDFSIRPAVYRALLGSHYFDDGLQVSLTLPTDFYWRLSIEALQGNQVSSEDDIGLYTVSTKFGGDISDSHSWQAGLSYMNNRSPSVDDDHDHDEAEHDHAEHSHGLSYYGENLYGADLVWKWAPRGNNRQQQVSLSAEYLYVDDLNEFASKDDFHEGWYTSAVWQFTPQWSTGVRYGEVDLKQPHGDHFHSQSLQESDWMLSYAHSHFSTLRLHYLHQSGDGLEEIDNTIMFQFVMSFGEHGAHEF
jgi:hypothetical protein